MILFAKGLLFSNADYGAASLVVLGVFLGSPSRPGSWRGFCGRVPRDMYIRSVK